MNVLAWEIKGESSRLTVTAFVSIFLIRCSFLHSSPVLVALYMFSMGKAEPRPYSNTLERAGMSWVVVTSTFTQFGLE